MKSGRVLALCLGAMFAVAGCSFHVNTGGVAVTSATVEEVINEKTPTEFHQRFEELPLGHAHCPQQLMELDHGKTAMCDFIIGSVALPLIVKLDENGRIVFRSDGYVFDLNQVAAFIDSSFLQDYRVRAKADCGTRRYRVYKEGDRFSCALKGQGLPRTVIVKVLPDGKLFTYRPKGLHSPEDVITGPILARHKRGLPVFLSGANATRLANDLFLTLHGFNRAWRVPAVDCPAQLNLSGNRRGICVVSMLGKTARLAFWIQHGDWNLATLDLIYSRRDVEAEATKYYQELERNNGFTEKVFARCAWPDSIVVTPPARRDCKLHFGAKVRNLQVHFNSRSGGYNFFVE